MITKEELDHKHQSVPVDYYQRGVKTNIFQKYWHGSCIKHISRVVKNLNLNGKILDLGCHSGDRTNVINKATDCQVYGIDISPQAIDYAKSRFSKITFIYNDFPRNSPFSDSYFQAVTAFDVLEHVPDLPDVLAEIKRLLNKDGYLVVGIPSENFLFKLAWFFWTRLRGKVWDDIHVHDFKKEGFKLFEDQGFSIVGEKNIIFNMWKIIVFRVKKINL
tara:strand:- start:13586 stop:14239 length:654 start_codon:yes stop_codon:yes gene_type:complete